MLCNRPPLKQLLLMVRWGLCTSPFSDTSDAAALPFDPIAAEHECRRSRCVLLEAALLVLLHLRILVLLLKMGMTVATAVVHSTVSSRRGHCVTGSKYAHNETSLSAEKPQKWMA